MVRGVVPARGEHVAQGSLLKPYGFSTSFLSAVSSEST
jgi:hypothetical protein